LGNLNDPPTTPHPRLIETVGVTAGVLKQGDDGVIADLIAGY
jgi:hypothetical protein